MGDKHACFLKYAKQSSIAIYLCLEETNNGALLLLLALLSFQGYRATTAGKSLKHPINHNYNKILKSYWLSPVLISALIGQCNRTVRASCLSNWRDVPSRARLNGIFFFLLAKFPVF